MGHYTLTIFDSDSMCSFIYVSFVSQTGFELEPLLSVLLLVPNGVDLIARDRVKDGQVIVAGQTLSVDLIVVRMTDFDVILWMDWLAKNYVSIYCYKKNVVFSLPSRSSFKFKSACTRVTPKLFLMMKAKRLIQQGGWTKLVCVVDTKGKEKTMDTVLLVSESPDVFSEDSLGIPPS